MLSRIAFIVCAALVLTLTSYGDPPLGAKNPIPNDGQDLPLGKWKVEFANGVVETVEVGRSGAVYVAEPKRTSTGLVTVKTVAFVLVFDDDRVERWTPVGQRMVVEHWFPGSSFPNGTPVRGIAEQVPSAVPPRD